MLQTSSPLTVPSGVRVVDLQCHVVGVDHFVQQHLQMNKRHKFEPSAAGSLHMLTVLQVARECRWMGGVWTQRVEVARGGYVSLTIFMSRTGRSCNHARTKQQSGPSVGHLR